MEGKSTIPKVFGQEGLTSCYFAHFVDRSYAPKALHELQGLSELLDSTLGLRNLWITYFSTCRVREELC